MASQPSGSGITPQTWADHFEVIAPPALDVKDPLVLRKRTVRVLNERYRGFAMRIDLEKPETKALRERVVRLNRFFTQHRIAPFEHRGFRRIFSNGDAPDFRWNKVGRLYAIGGGYQQANVACGDHTRGVEGAPSLRKLAAYVLSCSMDLAHLLWVKHTGLKREAPTALRG